MSTMTSPGTLPVRVAYTPDCRHPVTPEGVGTGYATTRDGRTLCYGCADDVQREDMRTADRFDAYLSRDGRTVTTWSGGALARVTWERPVLSFATPTGGEYDVTFVRAETPDGSRWHGRGPGRGMYVRLARSRSNR